MSGMKEEAERSAMRQPSISNLDSESQAVHEEGPEASLDEPRILYIFADDQTIHDNTQCFRFDINQLIKKYYIFNNGTQQSIPLTSETVKMQQMFYEQAVRELIEEVTLRFGPRNDQEGFQHLFLLDGKNVKGLLDIAEDAIIMIASASPTLVGVTFEGAAFANEIYGSNKKLVDQIINSQKRLKGQPSVSGKVEDPK